MTEALGRNLRVLILSKGEGVVVEIADGIEVIQAVPKIWGLDKRFEHRRAAITKAPIFPEAISVKDYLKEKA